MKQGKLGLAAMRVLALSVSIGTVGFLMVRAAGGCSSSEPVGARPEPGAPVPSGSTASEEAPAQEYLPAGKSWGGQGSRVFQPDAGADPRGVEGHYFPGTKAPAGRMPGTEPQAPNPPPQPQQQVAP